MGKNFLLGYGIVMLTLIAVLDVLLFLEKGMNWTPEGIGMMLFLNVMVVFAVSIALGFASELGKRKRETKF